MKPWRLLSTSYRPCRRAGAGSIATSAVAQGAVPLLAPALAACHAGSCRLHSAMRTRACCWLSLGMPCAHQHTPQLAMGVSRSNGALTGTARCGSAAYVRLFSAQARHTARAAAAVPPGCPKQRRQALRGPRAMEPSRPPSGAAQRGAHCEAAWLPARTVLVLRRVVDHRPHIRLTSVPNALTTATKLSPGCGLRSATGQAPRPPANPGSQSLTYIHKTHRKGLYGPPWRRHWRLSLAARSSAPQQRSCAFDYSGSSFMRRPCIGR